MAKKIKFESFKYRFLIAAQGRAASIGRRWTAVVGGLRSGARIQLRKGRSGHCVDLCQTRPPVVSLDEPSFHLRGDSERDVARQRESGLEDTEDPIKLKNDIYFRDIVMRVAQSAGYGNSDQDHPEDGERLATEREFHDAWADGEDVGNIDVRAANEACTAPEMRYITQRLGDIRGKRFGCGLRPR